MPGPFYDLPTSMYDAGLRYADAEVNPNKPKKMASLKLNLSRLNPEQRIALGLDVAGKLAPVAPDTPPIPNMAAKAALLKTAADNAKDSNDAYETAKSSLTNLLATRNADQDILIEELKSVGGAVESEAKGNAVMLTASGFQLAGTPAPTTQPPGKVLNLAISAGDIDGTLQGTFDPQGNVRLYEIQCTTVDPVNGPWTNLPTTTISSFTALGLTSGQRCWFRVRAVNVVGPGGSSDPATKIVP